MNQEQKDIMIANRTQLIENITVKDGLYSQLIQKKVLAQRTVNRIKGAGVDERQVEELLDELVKRDCFDIFCQALIDDTQVDVVKKYLKPPPMVAASSQPGPLPTLDAASIQIPTQPHVQPQQSTVTTDCAASVKRTHPSSPQSAILCIRENDNEHLILQYAPTPKKLPRQESLPVTFENDETRYQLKHYVSEELILETPHVFNNPQSLTNPNINDPQRYSSAFIVQPAEIQGIEALHKLSQSDSQKKLCNLLHSQNTFQISNIQQTASVQNNISRMQDPNSKPSIYMSQKGVMSTVKVSGVQESASLGSNDDSVDTISTFGSAKLLSKHPSQFSNVERVLLRDKETFDAIRDVPKYTELPSEMVVGFEDDMNAIDLPDGCVNVDVSHCTKHFFVSNIKKSYPMQKIPRGLALIINVDEVAGKPPRKGTNIDRDNLINLLSQLHFDLLVYNDRDGLTALDIVNKLKHFAKLKEHENSDACFICLLSHGEEGYIFGTDGKRIPLEEIFLLFGNTNCKGLLGKPKIFIIQACRGVYVDKGVQLDEPDGGPPRAVKESTQLPSLSDMLICYPTQNGYYAWRNKARGSWYIEAIVQIFMRYAKNEDICTMLNRVNYLVSKKVSECNLQEMNSMSQMSEYKSTLRRPHLFLFPGFGVTADQTL